MTSFFPNPMSSDGMDRLNYKWVTLLLLVLSLVSFIVPLHPMYQKVPNQSEANSPPWTTSIPTTTLRTTAADRLPYVKATCWCPREFTSQYVRYANTACGTAFNSMIRGEERHDVDILYGDPKMSDLHIPMGDRKDDQKAWGKSTRELFERKRNELKRQQRDAQHLEDRVQKLVTYQTPMMLLVFGLCLAIPQTVWSFLSSCTSSINVAQTLEAATRVDHMATGPRRKQTLEEFSTVLTASARSSPKTLSVLYLVKKTLSVLVVFALLLAVGVYVPPHIEELDNSVSKAAQKTDNTAQKTDNTTIDDPYGRFICGLNIRQLQNMQSWTLNCLATRVDDGGEDGGVGMSNILGDVATDATATTAAATLKNIKNLLDFESIVIGNATAILAILAVGNTASLACWLYKLVCSGGGSGGRSGSSNKSRNYDLDLSSNTLDMDRVFLVHMARINASVTVSQMLARGRGEDSDKTHFLELENQ